LQQGGSSGSSSSSSSSGSSSSGSSSSSSGSSSSGGSSSGSRAWLHRAGPRCGLHPPPAQMMSFGFSESKARPPPARPLRVAGGRPKRSHDRVRAAAPRLRGPDGSGGAQAGGKHIGRYGNGFKTSSIRLGGAAIVFTRHRRTGRSRPSPPSPRRRLGCGCARCSGRPLGCAWHDRGLSQHVGGAALIHLAAEHRADRRGAQRSGAALGRE
jgi:hypothetical protein